MKTINKAQAGRKVVKKKTAHPNDDYKDMVDPATGKKGTMGGEGTRPPFGGPGPKKGTKVYDIGTGRYETVKKNGGPVKKVIKKAKNGAKFDLNKDGKTTFKDVLIGRGVLPKKAKSGIKMKKAQVGMSMSPAKVKSVQQKTNDNVAKIQMRDAANSMQKSAAANAKNGKSMKKCKYGCK